MYSRFPAGNGGIIMGVIFTIFLFAFVLMIGTADNLNCVFVLSFITFVITAIYIIKKSTLKN